MVKRKHYYRKKINKKWKNKIIYNQWVLLFGAIFLFNTTLLAWNFYSHNKIAIQTFIYENTPINPTPTITLTPTPTAIPSTSTYLKEYKLKHFEQDDHIGNFQIASLVPSDESVLIPISCSVEYGSFENEYEDTWISTVREKVDSNIQSYSEILMKQYPNQLIRSVSACSDKNGQVILFYNLCKGMNCGGGSNGFPFIGLIEKSSIVEIAKIPNEVGMPYYGCRNPLQLTKGSDFYFICGGGDGPGGGSTLFKLNLTTKILTNIKSCSTILGETTCY